MELKDAIALIEKNIERNTNQRWADLGCGSGTFTNALANILKPESIIYAVDKSYQRIASKPGNDVQIEFIQQDFAKEILPLRNLDGILMANSLHYVKDKEDFIRNAEDYFSDKINFVIVEYDTNIANQWVPYPVRFTKLKELFARLNYNDAEKTGEYASIFGRGNMYAARLQKEKRK